MNECNVCGAEIPEGHDLCDECDRKIAKEVQELLEEMKKTHLRSQVSR